MSEKVALATEMQYYHNQFCQFGLGYEFKLRRCGAGIGLDDPTPTPPTPLRLAFCLGPLGRPLLATPERSYGSRPSHE